MQVAAQTVVTAPLTAEAASVDEPVTTSLPEDGPSPRTSTTDTSNLELSARNEPAAALEMAAAVVTRVVEMLGLASVAGTIPGVPAESPLLLAMLGWARKESQLSAADEQAAEFRVATAATSEPLDGEMDSAAMALAALAVPNTAPEWVQTSVGTPDSGTGVVTGTVTGSDDDGDALTYSLSGAQPTGGTVVVNSNGTFTFTPTAAARFAAMKTPTADAVSFEVAISDGQTTTTKPVSVSVAPADLTGSSLAGLGLTPSGVAMVGNVAYVANQGSGTVVVYDMSGPIAKLVKTIVVGSAPTAVVANESKVYVTNQYSHTVSVIDTSTNTVSATIGVGAYPVAATLSDDGSQLYVANLYSLSVSVVNTATNTVVATVPLSSHPGAIAISPDGTRVYVTNQYANTVSVINTATNTVTATVNVGATPSSVAVGDTRAVVTNQGGNSVSIINTATGAVIGTVSLPAGGAPTSVVMSNDGTVAYVASNNDTISVIDLTAATPSVVRTMVSDSVPEAGAQALALSADGTRLYVVDATSRVLRAISISSVVQPATVTSGLNATNTSIVGGIEAANLGAPAGQIGFIGTDANDLVEYQPGYWNPNWKTAQNGTVGQVTYATTSWGIDMLVDGTRYVEFNAYAQGAPHLQIWVDDVKVSDPFQPYWSTFGPNTLKIDFGEGNTGPHRVRVMFSAAAGTNGIAVGKIWTESAGSVTAPPPTGPRLFVLGDSTSAGTYDNVGFELGTWIPQFAELAGIRDYWNGAIVATSYEPTLFGFANFKTRAGTEVVPSAADIVIVATPNIDIFLGHTPGSIAANVDNVVDTISAMPNHPKIIIVGAFDASGVNGPTYTNVDAAIIPVISGRAAYVSTVGGPLIGYSGETLVASSEPWVTAANRPYILGADNLHPNDAGQAGLAGKMLEVYQALEAAGGNRAPVVGTPSPPNVNSASGVVTGSLNFTDPDGDTLTYNVPTQPSSGTVTVGANGTYTFTPTQAARDAAAAGTGPTSVTFTVTASDGEANPVPVQLTVPISPTPPPNQPPVAGTPSEPSVNPVTGVATGQLNFTDANGDPLTYNVPTQPSSGTVTVSANGSYTFTPTQAARDAAAAGTGPTSVTFTVTATDNRSAPVSTQVTVPISPTPAANQAPVITGTTVNTPNQSSGVVTGSVTATDANGNTLTYSLSGPQPAGGTVVVNANGTFTYTPTLAARLAAGQTAGPDANTFTVAVSDGLATTTTTVTVNVLPADLSMAASTAATGAAPSAVAIVGNLAYVGNQGTHTVSVIDTTTNTVVKTIPVGYLPTGIVAGANKVYVANGWSNTVSVIDTATNTVSATIDVGQGPWALAVSRDGSRLYVANLISYSVSVINTANNTVIASVPVGAYPNALAVSPDGTRVYATNQYSYTVSVIDAATNTVIASVPVGVMPSSVAVGDTRAVVTNQGANSVSIINTTTATPTVIATIALPAGTSPTSAVMSKDGTVAYVANTNDTISVINLTAATPSVMRTLQIDSVPENGAHALTFNDDGTKLFITDTNDNTLRTLSLMRGNTAPVAGTPSQTGVNQSSGVVTGQLNFTDTDGDTLTYSVPTQPSSGTVTLSPSTGTYTFTPTAAARNTAATTPGPDSVTFTVTASDGRSAPVSVPVTAPIVPTEPGVNNPPTVGTSSTPTVNTATGVVTGQLNFNDADGDSLSYSVPTQPTSGSVAVSNTGVYTFTPTQAARDASAAGTGSTSVTFTVAATDNRSAPVSTQVTVPISPTAANQAPVVTGKTVNAPNLSTGVVTGAVTATDANGDALTYSLSGDQPAGGTVKVEANGTFTFTPTGAARLAAQTSGADFANFSVAVSDGQNVVTTTVSVPVAPAELTVSGSAVTTGATPAGAVIVGNRAFVTNQYASTVSVIDTTTNAVVKTIVVGALPTGIAAGGNKVYVANGWSNTVSVIDTTSLTVTATIAVGSGPLALTISTDPAGSRLYVANATANSVSVINTATNTVIATVPVGAFPMATALSSNGSQMYVVNQNGHSVSVINTTTAAVVATVPVGSYPSSIAVNGTRAYVTNQGANTVSVIDLNTATVVSTIALGANTAPTSVVLSKDGTLAYVANSNDTITVINTATNTVLRTVQIDTTPETGSHTLTFNADGTRLFITDSADNRLRWASLTAPSGGPQQV